MHMSITLGAERSLLNAADDLVPARNAQAATAPTMEDVDVVSSVAATLRTCRPKFTRSRRSGSWGNRFGPYPGAGFHVVLRGSCWLITATEPPIPLQAGDAVLLPHGSGRGMSDRPYVRLQDLPPDEGADRDVHRQLPVHADLLCGAYRVDRSLAHPLLRSLPDVIHLPAGSHHDVSAVVDLLVGELSGPGAGSDAALPALLDLIMVHLIRGWLHQQTSGRLDRGWPAAMADPVLVTALEGIHNDPARHWSVQDLADVSGLSKTAFVRRFTHVVGQSPAAYLTWWRLNAAARVLSHSDAPLAAVAHQVGYSSEFAFAHAFRRYFEVPPGRFRHQQRLASDREAPVASGDLKPW